MYSHDHNLRTTLMTIDGMMELPNVHVGLAADTQSVANVGYLQTFIAVLLCTLAGRGGSGQMPIPGS